MSGSMQRLGRCLLVSLVLAGAIAIVDSNAMAQEELVVRTPPPALDDLETDANHDGLPDGWYNARNATWMSERGAPAGPHFVRFECSEPGGPAVLSRAFGIDRKKTAAIELGIWVRLKNVQFGERDGGDPSLVIDFIGPAPSGVGPAVGRRVTRPVDPFGPRKLDAGRQADCGPARHRGGHHVRRAHGRRGNPRRRWAHSHADRRRAECQQQLGGQR